jgi:uncharacterized FlgJ-related protein
MGDSQYVILSKAKIQETRNLIISKNSYDGGFTMAQQIVVNEGSRRTTLFVKGTIQVDNLSCLYELRDALNEAINKAEQNTLLPSMQK